jgi:hypothetical protein
VSDKAKPRSVTKVTSTASPSAVTPANRRAVEEFQIEHGRLPAPGDGAVYAGLVIARGANLERQAKTGTGWAQWTAIKMLACLPGLSRLAVPRAARPRETSAPWRRRYPRRRLRRPTTTTRV